MINLPVVSSEINMSHPQKVVTTDYKIDPSDISDGEVKDQSSLLQCHIVPLSL